MAGRRPTSADVAKRAGVSRATVSYVLSDSTRHSFPQPTRDRVFAAAEELGYTPHAAALALRKGESGVVLLVMEELPYGGNLANFLAALSDAVWQTGRSMVTWSPAGGQTLRDTLYHLNPRAVVALMPLPVTDRDALASAGIPLVPTAYGFPTEDVLPDSTLRLELTVGALQVQHLAALGHRRIGVISLDDDRLRILAASRREGAARAALDLGLELPRMLILGPPDEDAVAMAARTLQAWVSSPQPVTGVCCYNDLYAGVALTAARAAGLGVPEDLSVIGVGDEPFGQFFGPALTTIRYDFADVAGYVSAWLRAVLDEGPMPATPTSQKLEVVQRESATPPEDQGLG
jgi:DNA-binding LacI/PurR family transcriptional regulator